MSGRAPGGIRWAAVALGWAVAVLAGVVTSIVLRFLFGLVLDPPIESGELTATSVVVSVVSGFLSYLVGGYVAARVARYSGGKHGALAAFLGLILGIILTVVLSPFGVVFSAGVAVPPAGFGFAGYAPVAALCLFLANLFGGFVGGTLGEPLHPDAKRPG